MSLIITLPFYVCSFSWNFEKSSHSGWCLIPPLSSATWLTLPIEMILCQFQAEASGIRTYFHLLSHASAIMLRKTRFSYPLVLGGEWETCGTKWLSQAQHGQPNSNPLPSPHPRCKSEPSLHQLSSTDVWEINVYCCKPLRICGCLLHIKT